MTPTPVRATSAAARSPAPVSAGHPRSSGALPRRLISAYLADQAKRKTLAPKLGTFEPPSRIKRLPKRRRVKP